MAQDKTYFLSDLHLGAPYISEPKEHEIRIISFLDSIKHDAKDIYFVGDIFDFWFEWEKVIPKGFVRFQGKIAELADNGIGIHFFGGNHDMWMRDYFEKELGVKMYFEPTILELEGQRCYIAHGEDLGIDDFGFKFILKIFRSSCTRWLFSTFIHPNVAIKLAYKWSNNSRKNHKDEELKFLGEDKEHLIKFAKQYEGEEEINFFIFGHRHIELDLMIKKNTRVVILGDWINQYTYAVLHEGHLVLETQDF